MTLAIFGAGGQGKEVLELAQNINEKENRWDEMVFIDDVQDEGTCMGIKRVHYTTFEKMNAICEFIIALGEPVAKRKIYDFLKDRKCSFAILISPDAQVSSFAMVGEGVIIKRGAIVSPQAEIGKNTTLQSYVAVGHDAIVGEHCQISTHSVIGGHTVLGNEVFVGLHCPIRDRVTIGSRAVISAGAVVLKSVPENVTVMGNPCRVVQCNEEKNGVFV